MSLCEDLSGISFISAYCKIPYLAEAEIRKKIAKTENDERPYRIPSDQDMKAYIGILVDQYA